jgi:hypothetical protein
MNQSVSDAVLAFKSNKSGIEDTLAVIAIYAYNYPRKKFGLNEDDSSDFFLQFYPRLKKMLIRFQDQGKPFEAYLHTCLNWHFRSFLAYRKKRDSKWQLASDKDFWQHQSSSKYCHCTDAEIIVTEKESKLFHIDISGKIAENSIRRRILLLTMKNILEMEEGHLKHIAILTGFDYDWIVHCSDRLRFKVHERSQRLDYLREKRNKIYYNLKIIEHDALTAYTPEEKESVNQKMGELKRRLKNIQLKISRVLQAPTHTEIADVLSIPKGSVDSGIYYLRNSVKRLYEEEQIEYA